MRVLTLSVALISIVAACAEDNGQSTQSVDAATLTYHADIAPIIQAECTSCHSPDNIGPFDLTSLANVQQYSAAIEQSIRSGSMPPIPAKDTNCQELDDERIMNAADKRKVLDWIDAGMPAEIPQPPARSLKMRRKSSSSPKKSTWVSNTLAPPIAMASMSFVAL